MRIRCRSKWNALSKSTDGRQLNVLSCFSLSPFLFLFFHSFLRGPHKEGVSKSPCVIPSSIHSSTKCGSGRRKLNEKQRERGERGGGVREREKNNKESNWNESLSSDRCHRRGPVESFEFPNEVFLLDFFSLPFFLSPFLSLSIPIRLYCQFVGNLFSIAFRLSFSLWLIHSLSHYFWLSLSPF